MKKKPYMPLFINVLWKIFYEKDITLDSIVNNHYKDFACVFFYIEGNT